MEEKRLHVAITHGDTNGIGYEIIFKAFEDPTMLELCTPIIYGSPKTAAFHRNLMNLETPFNIISKAEEARDGKLNILTTFEEELKVEPGKPTSESADAARKAIQYAKEDLKKGLYDVLVLAPTVSSNTPDKEDRSLLVMFADDIRIALVTNHLPIKEVAQTISQDLVIEKATIFHTSLKRDFRISNPRIAALSINPQIGKEEEGVLKPAIEKLAGNGIQIYGPFTADEFFGQNMRDSFDGILTMYDDQGNVAFKTLATEYGVKMKTGFPFVITTPDHGPAFDIAGKGIADPASLRHAVYAAIDIFRNRKDYDEPLKNPLPKLYHEKKEDGERARFPRKPLPPKSDDSSEKTE